MFLYQVEEVSADVGGDAFIKRWMKWKMIFFVRFFFCWMLLGDGLVKVCWCLYGCSVEWSQGSWKLSHVASNYHWMISTPCCFKAIPLSRWRVSPFFFNTLCRCTIVTFLNRILSPWVLWCSAISPSNINGVNQRFLTDRRVEFLDIENHELCLVFVIDTVELLKWSSIARVPVFP